MDLKEGNVTIMVADMERAIQFYVQTMGFTVRERHGDDWAEIQTPGLVIGIHPVSPGQQGKASAGPLSIGWTVDRLEAVMAALTQRGVRFEVREEGAVRLAFFQDVDSTPLYLCELKHPHA